MFGYLRQGSGQAQHERTSVWLAGIFAVVCGGNGAASAQELSPYQIYAKTAPAVVFIAGYGPGLKGIGGTGSVIDASGLVLTNAHVVVEEGSHQPYPQIAVYLKPDRVTGIQEKDLSRRMKGRVVAFDRSLDLALVKLESVPSGVAPLEFGDPDQVRIGDRVVAIGHPEQGGLWTLTTGVISSEFDDFQKIVGKNVFQTEASFNRGNSGGPLLDAYGHQVGINTSIARQAADGMAIVSINFSVKSSVAQTWLTKQGVQVAYAARSAELPSGSVSVQAAPPAPMLPPMPPLPQEPSKAPSSGVPSTPGIPPAPAFPPLPPLPAPGIPPPVPDAKGSTPQSGSPSRPSSETHVPPDPHPYDLDRLVQGLEAAEKDLENLMDEMQRKTRRRP